MSKKLNTNSNTYIIIYAVVMVVIVAFLLAFVGKALQSKSDANVAIDKKAQILSSLNIRNVESDDVETRYAEVVVADKVVDANGNDVEVGEKKDANAFKMSSKDITPDKLPLYVCNIDGETKYVVPVYGMGLWGGLWGYLAINNDGNTIYGAYFSHQSETAGLGALITENKFQQQFQGKSVYDSEGKVALSVVKVGKVVEGLEANSRCDAITGATLTTNGVDEMLKSCLGSYQNVFKNIVK